MSQPPLPNSAQRIVTSLAVEAELPVEEVAQLYEDQRAELDRGARIKNFLPIFAIRGVQDVLRRRRDRGLLERAKPQPYGTLVGTEV